MYRRRLLAHAHRTYRYVWQQMGIDKSTRSSDGDDMNTTTDRPANVIAPSERRTPMTSVAPRTFRVTLTDAQMNLLLGCLASEAEHLHDSAKDSDAADPLYASRLYGEEQRALALREYLHVHTVHDPSGRGCAIAGRAKRGATDLSDACPACLATIEAR